MYATTAIGMIHETHLGRFSPSPSLGASNTGSVGGGSNRRRRSGVSVSSNVSTSTVTGSGASTVWTGAGGSNVGTGSGSPSASTSWSSSALSSRSKRLGHLPHVRQELATGSLMVPHWEHRQGAVAIDSAYSRSSIGTSTSWIREPSSAESSNTTSVPWSSSTTNGWSNRKVRVSRSPTWR